MALIICIAFLPLDTVDAATVKKVKLNKTSVTLYAGKTVQLKVQGTSKKVTWSSGNKKVATVYKGKVTTKKAGTATITAKVGKKKYTCKVTVKSPYLNKKKAYLYIGQTSKLKLTGATIKSYTSKNKAVATVTKKGVITAKKKGTATIVAKDTKGRTYNCTVTVKAAYLNQTKIYLGVGDSSRILLTGANAISWISDNEEVATVSSEGVVTAHYIGTAVLTCTADNGQTFTVKVTTSCYNHTEAVELTTASNCIQRGVERHYCLTCDYTYNQILPLGEHDYVYSSTIAPSKDAPGYEAYLCSVCGKLDSRNQVDYHPTTEQVYRDMMSMQASYPEGMPWTNNNFYEWNGGYYSGGYGCAGFAFMLSDAAFGYLPARVHEDFDTIKTGDILRLNNDGHSVVVIAISGDTYTLAEGSYNNSVHWGRTMTLAEIKEIGTYVMTRYPQ